MRWLILLLLSSCSYYAAPESGTYKITYKLYDTMAEMREGCGVTAATKWNACASWKGRTCTIHMPKNEWERHTVHEVAHCLLGKTHG